VATTEHRRAGVLLLLLAAAGLILRFWQSPATAPGAVAYTAPGPRPVRDSVVARAARLARPLGAAERIDLDRASAEELARLPRVGPGLAARIVADREEHGPFGSLAALDRVSGVGPTLLAAIGPHAGFSAAGRVSPAAGRPGSATAGSPLIDYGAFAVAGYPSVGAPAASAPPARPARSAGGGNGERGVRINTASEAELDQLPGIGPALARAIVAERAAHGPFRTVEDLRRVRGLGAATRKALAGRIIVP
jgi:competence ComEA-like helix-hairpin-helix protein